MNKAHRSPLIARFFPKEGFTLIEILIVVTIIGLLASTVLIGLAPAQRRGRDARRLSDIKEVQNALELYYSKCGRYPGDSGCSGGAAANFTEMTAALTGAGIGVSQIPNDPSSGKSYQYSSNDTGTQYVLAATLEDSNNQVLNTPPSVPSGITGIKGSCGKADSLYCVVF